MKKPNPKAKKLLHNRTIVHIVTGSIAAYKAGDLVTMLREAGARVICVMSPSAKEFVTPLVLRALSGEPVYDEFFSADTPYEVLHTSLAETADLILVSPASADFIARAAVGMANDLPSCILLASAKPVLFVPAMNDQMYSHPMTQENIQRLKAIGHRFVGPIEGHLVCGREAVGHVASPESILEAAAEVLN